LGKAKPKLKIDIEFEWVQTPDGYHKEEYKRKSRQIDMENASNISPRNAIECWDSAGVKRFSLVCFGNG